MRSYLFNLIQAIQACIDIGVHIISDSEWQTRPTKAEIFEILTSKWVQPSLWEDGCSAS